MAVLKRLAENLEEVILEPGRFYHYYSFLKDPWNPILIAEKAKYFYYSGGSKWASWRDRNYIQSFSEALDSLIPRRDPS